MKTFHILKTHEISASFPSPDVTQNGVNVYGPAFMLSLIKITRLLFENFLLRNDYLIAVVN